MEVVSGLIEAAYHSGRFVFIIGNGGFVANASHLGEDLARWTLRDDEGQGRLIVLNLTGNATGITALTNDKGDDRVCVEQLKDLASRGDLLLAISGSGNSPNILKAVDWANKNGLTTIGITGFSGGELKELACESLHAAVADTGLIESLHQIIFRWIIDDLHRRFSTEGLGGWKGLMVQPHSRNCRLEDGPVTPGPSSSPFASSPSLH